MEEPVATFLGRARLLEGKLGPLLYQLPPNVHRNDWLLESFLSLLPRDLMHVFEFRHESWLVRAGFCIFDMPDLTTPIEATADFAYVRFHGSTTMYDGCYSDGELTGWASRIAALAGDARRVYVYFNNDAEGFAISNALTLREKLAG